MSERMESLIDAYTSWIIRRRWSVLVLCVGVTALVASGLGRLQFSSDYRAFFGKTNPQLNAFDAIERIYTKNDNVLFVLQPSGGDVFTPRVLGAVKEITAAGWKVPYSLRVDSITNFQYTRAEEDDLIVADLVSDPERLSAQELEQIRGVALTEPLLRDRLISPNSSTTGVNVRLQLPGSALTELTEVMTHVRRLAAQLREKYPYIRIELTGTAVLSYAFAEAPAADLGFLTPLMYGLLIAAMVVFLRSFSGTVTAVGVVGLSALLTMGAAGWMGIKLNGVSVSAPTIILTVGIADSVHLLVSMFAAMRRGASRHDALIESMRINHQPVFLTSLTTVIGFLSLNFSDAPPLRDLGNLTAIGVAAAWAFSMAFLPALMAILPVRVRPAAANAGRGMSRLAEVVIAHQRSLLLGIGALVVTLTACTALFEINDRPVEYFDESIEFRRATDFATENLMGLYGMSFSVGAGGSSGINDPEYLRRLDAFAEWLRAQPVVHHVSTLTDTVKRLNKNMHGDDPAYYRLPDSRDLAAQYLLLYEMSLPYGLDLNDQINVDKSATRLDVVCGDVDFKILKDLKARAEEWLRTNGLPSMVAEGASPAVMFAYIAERNIHSMVRGTITALLLISVVLTLSLRSVRLGLISVVPNVIPIGMAFGLWALVFGEVGFAVSIVAGVSIGIIVDDTIHFLSKYLRARRVHGMNPPDAVRYAFSTVGHALWVTSLILVVGFSTLSMSAFWPNATLGLLTALAIAAALLADFLFLPPLLMALDGKEMTAHELAVAKTA
jgi:predicted RND superfamily exporter protein